MYSSYINRICCFGREVDKGKYAETDNFVHCEEIVRRAEYLLVTNHRLIYAQRNDMFGVWNVSEARPIFINISIIFMLIYSSLFGCSVLVVVSVG